MKFDMYKKLALRSVAILTGLCLFTGLAVAGPVPNFGKQIDISVREQPIHLFLGALFREIGVPALVSEEVEGTVNGRFNGRAREIFGEVANAFNVVVYYDSSVAHVYPANSLSQRVLPMADSKAKSLMQIATQMGLTDASNELKKIDNGVIAAGTPRFLQQIEELQVVAAKTANRQVKKASSELEPDYTGALIDLGVKPAARKYPNSYRVFQLRHAWADDTTFTMGGQSVTVPGVATILRNLISGDPMMYNPTGRVREPSNRSLDGLRGKGLQMVDQRGVETVVASQRFDSKRVSSASKLEDIRIVADTRLNAIIIRDTADRMPAYADLIRTLDVPSTMVEIEATIIDINADRSRELGINWRYNGSDGAFQFGSAGASDGSLTSPGVLNPQGRGGVLSFMLGEPNEFLARIQALEEDGAARVVSKPHVITLSDVEAVLGATTEFFVRVAGDEEVDLFNVPVGTLLRVTPHVFRENGEHHIKLLVNIEDGSPSGSETVDSIPVIERSNINTQAVVREGDSLLVGGLVRESYREFTYRVPVLGSIPLVGRLFRSDRNTTTRVERLFMLTPRIAKNNGFASTRNLPRLQGQANDIIATSGQRLDQLSWPKRADQRYWPEEKKVRRLDRQSQQPAVRGNSQREPASSTVVPITPTRRPVIAVNNNRPNPVYRSSFGVEPWANSRNNQSSRTPVVPVRAAGRIYPSSNRTRNVDVSNGVVIDLGQ